MASHDRFRILLGVVMANGWPIAHHVFPGSERDQGGSVNAEKSTLVGVLRDLDQRFGLNRVMVVGDRGMVSPPHLDFLSGTPFRYLLGIPGRRCEEAATALEALDDEKWERVDEGNRVQEVSLSLPGAASGRYFVIESRERKSKERAGLALRTLVWHWGYNANTPWTPRPSRMTRAFSGL